MAPSSRPAHRAWLLGWALVLTGSAVLWVDPALARKEVLTPEEKDHQRQASQLRLDAIALTAHGPIATTELEAAATAQLSQLGYQVVANPAQPHDATLKIKCEERKTWEGTDRLGGDADRIDAAVRLWKGPACQLSYRFDGRWAEWRHEIRTDFSDPQEGAQRAGQTDAGAYAIAQLTARLRTDPFPLLLAAEWGQAPRILAALHAGTITPEKKQMVITLLGTMLADEAIPDLTTALQDANPAIVQSAAVALGTIGHEDSIAPLLNLFRSGPPQHHQAAALGLGRLAPLHPTSEIVPTLLAALPKEPIPLQTVIVRALGKTTDRRVLEPLRALHRATLKQTRSDSTPELKELLVTLGIALDGFDGVHTEE